MESDQTYLVVSNKRDLTSDFIVREFFKQGLKFYRLNTEDVTQFSFTQHLGGATTLQNGNTCIKLSTVRSAYFRRPYPPHVNSDGLSQAYIRYIREEWSYLLRSLYFELGEKWFNHPNSVILAEDKPRQLRLATKVGFSVPETTITNDIDTLKLLFANGDVIAKPLKQSLLEEDRGPGSVIYTTTINSINEIDVNKLHLAPVIFQRRIEKRFDLRVSIVETNVFAVAINSQKFEKTQQTGVMVPSLILNMRYSSCQRKWPNNALKSFAD